MASDSAADFLSRPFFEFYQRDSNTDAFELPLELANIVPPSFENDGPPKFPSSLEGLPLPVAKNSVERATLIIDSLLDAAGGLADIVNRHKRQEIERAITALEQSDLSDPDAKKRALADIVRLSRIRDRLEKQVRWTLPAWKVDG